MVTGGYWLRIAASQAVRRVRYSGSTVVMTSIGSKANWKSENFGKDCSRQGHAQPLAKQHSGSSTPSIEAWTQPASLKKRGGGRKSCIFS